MFRIQKRDNRIVMNTIARDQSGKKVRVVGSYAFGKLAWFDKDNKKWILQWDFAFDKA